MVKPAGAFSAPIVLKVNDDGAQPPNVNACAGLFNYNL